MKTSTFTGNDRSFSWFSSDPENLWCPHIKLDFSETRVIISTDVFVLRLIRERSNILTSEIIEAVCDEYPHLRTWDILELLDDMKERRLIQ